MKSIKLLAALAIPAMFAACTNEDILSETSQQVQKEVVGAELIGTDISLNVTTGDIQSRIVNDEGVMKWTKEDRLGLGWMLTTKNDPTQVQTEDGDIANSKIWANHMFQMEGEEQGTFTTRGNIYKGWYFAYFPWAYQETLGKTLDVKVNPIQETMSLNERYSQNLHLSARQFVTANDLDENYQLEKPFELQNTMNTLYMTTKAVEGSAFAEGNALADITISSVTINAGAAVFADKVRVSGKVLPVAGDTILRDVLKNALISFKADGNRENRDSMLVTEISEDLVYKVSNGKGSNRIMPIALPMYDVVTVDTAKVSIVIEAGAGKFTVQYEDDAEEGTPAALNNAVLDKLVAAYAEEDGKMVNWTGFVQLGEIQLYDAIYEADYTGIMTYTDWSEAVYTANALNAVNPTFVLGDKANVVFTTETGITAPAGGVKVTSASTNTGASALTINGELAWNKNIDVNNVTGIKVVVDANAVLSVDSVLTPHRLYNNGTILAGALSTVGQKTNSGGNLVNTTGRVIVEYGAYVYTDRTQAGVIAYNVPTDYKIAEINTLMASDNTAGNANVNTLIVNEGVALNCLEKGGSNTTAPNTDRYNPTPGSTTTEADEKLNLTDSIDLEINGGEVSTADGCEVAAGNVTITEGGKLNGVNVNGEYLKITDGTVECTSIKAAVTAEDAKITAETIIGNVVLKGENTISGAEITGNVTVEEGKTTLDEVAVNGTLTNNAEVVLASESSINITTLVNNKTLTSNNDINVKDVSLTAGSVTTLKSKDSATYNKTIWYTGSYTFKEMTLNGTVAEYNGAVLKNAVENAEEGDVITLNGNATLTSALNIDKNITIDLNGKTLESADDALILDNGVKLVVKNGTIKAAKTALWNDWNRSNHKMEVTLDKCTVEGTSEDYTLVSLGNGPVKISGCIFKMPTMSKDTDRYVARLYNSTVEVADSEFSGANGGMSLYYCNSTLKNVNITCGKWYGLYICGYSDNCNSTLEYETLTVENGEQSNLYLGSGKCLVNNVEKGNVGSLD